MLASDFEYRLPEELIAQHPARERDASRLMLVHRASASWRHAVFADLPAALRPGDVLVVNESRVWRARLLTRRAGTGGRIEVLLLREESPGEWNALLKPLRRVRCGDRLELEGEKGHLEILRKEAAGHCRLRSCFADELQVVAERSGRTPLPPYIKRSNLDDDEEDRSRYQTLFAREMGSIAAPTAGLHFTPSILDRLEKLGILLHRITLHVGLATFKPMHGDHVEDHRLGPESYDIPVETAMAIQAARREGRRVIAVGTTTTRALESSAGANQGVVIPGRGEAEIFIRPPFNFQAIDGLLTNFHLPRSSLLVLVAAWAGRELLLQCYEEAVRQRYRFFSYGDCMLVL